MNRVKLTLHFNGDSGYFDLVDESTQSYMTLGFASYYENLYLINSDLPKEYHEHFLLSVLEVLIKAKTEEFGQSFVNTNMISYVINYMNELETYKPNLGVVNVFI